MPSGSGLDGDSDGAGLFAPVAGRRQSSGTPSSLQVGERGGDALDNTRDVTPERAAGLAGAIAGPSQIAQGRKNLPTGWCRRSLHGSGGWGAVNSAVPIPEHGVKRRGPPDASQATGRGTATTSVWTDWLP